MSVLCRRGFTLLEMIIVIAILALLAAMLYPAAGMLDDRERGKISREKMDEIRRAIIGDPDRFDRDGRRIIAGFVGDMGRWPHLYEPKAELKQHITGTPAPPVFNLGCSGNHANFHYRPAGSFTGKNWQWHFPYRQLGDDRYPYIQDHIGGLETENEGQPLGLWTDNPLGDGSSMLDLKRWRGPYLTPPLDKKPDDSGHFAENDGDFNRLEPRYRHSPPRETWKDGDYDVSLGEHFDEKEEFRLRQTDNRLADGWNRAFRFFITADSARPDGTIFWIISEGPDFEGTYPNKGNFNYGAWNWVDDSNDIMSRAYDPDDKHNKDNIVMKIYSHEWQGIFDEINQTKTQATEEIIDNLLKALIGDHLPHATSFNSGFTGKLCRLPRLFRWEGATTSWDDQDGTPTNYTKGQPRGLWTAIPNTADSTDNLLTPALANPAIGWSGAFFRPPPGLGENEKILDAWGREILFFHDHAKNALLILSRGADGLFDFLSTTTDFAEPANFTEPVVVAGYNPAQPQNTDNIVQIIHSSDWQPGWFRLETFTVLNIPLDGGNLKAAFYYGYDYGATPPPPPAVRQRVVAAADAVLVDDDGDGQADDWVQGDSATPAFGFAGANELCTGTRRLIIWDDTDADGIVDAGEPSYMKDYNILRHNTGPRNNLTVDRASTVHFTDAP